MLQRIQSKNSDATFCTTISLRKTDPDRTCSAVTFFIIFDSIFEIHLYEHDWMKERTGMKCLVPGASNIKSIPKFFGWPIHSASSFLNNEFFCFSWQTLLGICFEVVLITSLNSFFVRQREGNKENRKTWPTVSF